MLLFDETTESFICFSCMLCGAESCPLTVCKANQSSGTAKTIYLPEQRDCCLNVTDIETSVWQTGPVVSMSQPSKKRVRGNPRDQSGIKQTTYTQVPIPLHCVSSSKQSKPIDSSLTCVLSETLMWSFFLMTRVKSKENRDTSGVFVSQTGNKSF